MGSVGPGAFALKGAKRRVKLGFLRLNVVLRSTQPRSFFIPRVQATSNHS
jgi:hypothetical protein